ncbi:unnamed protein product [Colias eurytheme]|nr:unnamed protein product [Colias eurytheme]
MSKLIETSAKQGTSRRAASFERRATHEHCWGSAHTDGPRIIINHRLQLRKAFQNAHHAICVHRSGLGSIS